MQLPETLQSAIYSLVDELSLPHLRKACQELSSDYRQGKSSPFREREKLLAYLAVRMPATFAAVYQVLRSAPLFGHVLDLGAGPGTASWAALSLFPHLEKITLIERSQEMIELGKTLCQKEPLFQKAQWIQQSLEAALPLADAAIFSYVLAELNDPVKVLLHSFERVSLLVIVEPGTPKAFEKILMFRKELLAKGAKLLAPCPHSFVCPMPKEKWCHFAARVERSRLHRQMKEGSMGYEDEKFCYLVAAKERVVSSLDRIVGPVIKRPGHFRFPLCTEEGVLKEKIVTKKEGELYRQVRHLQWGDCFPGKEGI